MRGFTLIELMIVISIAAIVLATGVPAFLRSLEKEGLRKAESTLAEACSHARAQAILTGATMELVIRAEDGRVAVEPYHAKPEDAAPAFEPPVPEEGERPQRPKPTPRDFPPLEENVAVRLIAVNFKDQMEKPEARVRFFPNGTSDEFTILFFSEQGERKLSLDIITGLAEVEVIR